MATVFIPAQWKSLTAGVSQVETSGQTLRQVVAELEQQFPGIAERLCPDGKIAPTLQVSIDGALTSRGMLSPVSPHSEIHFLPAIGGG